MRTLDAALTTAQQAAKRKPYVRLYFDSRGGTTHTYTTMDATNRIRYVEQWEEGWAGAATIWLSNYDQGLSAADYRGYSVSVGWGMVLNSTPDSTWYSNAAVMKVLNQRDISYQGELITEFYCVSVWYEQANKHLISAGLKVTGVIIDGNEFVLGETITTSANGYTGRLACWGNDGTDDYIIVLPVTGTKAQWAGETSAAGVTASITIDTADDNHGPTVYPYNTVTLEAIIEAVTGLTVDVDEDDPDGMMAAKPEVVISLDESARRVVRNQMLRTKCGLRYENDNHLHALYLDTTDAAQYEFQSTHAFFEDLRDRAIILPNRCTFVDRLPDTQGNAATGAGSDYDTTSYNALGAYYDIIQVDPNIANAVDPDAEAVSRATSYIAQMVAQAYQGKITAPMECGLEVYDMVQCVDARLNVTTKGRIGRLERYFQPWKDRYEFIATLGSAYSEPGAMGGASGIESDLNDLSKNTNRVNRVPAPNVYPWQLWQAVQPYTVDITFSQSSTTGDNQHMSWGAGNIYFADGTSLSIDADADYAIGATPGWLVFTEGDSSLNFTSDFSEAVAPHTGIVAFIARGTETGETALILPYAGKAPALNADIISCIYLSALAASMGTLDAGTINIGGAGSGLNFNYSAALVGQIYGAASILAMLGNTSVTIGNAAGGGISLYGGSIETPVGNTTRIRSKTYTYIGTGDKTGSPSGNDMWLESDDDIWFYADTDILLKAGNRTYIDYLGGIKDDVTGSRAIASIYQNTTAYPKLCEVVVDVPDTRTLKAFVEAGDATPDVQAQGEENQSGSTLEKSVTFWVPIGSYYMVTCTSGSLISWLETRIGASA